MNKRRGVNILSVAIPVAAVLLTIPAAGASQEALSRYCNRVYKKLCRDITPGPEMLGKCFAKHPRIDARIPAKCTEDFQVNIENYNDAKAKGR